MENDESQTAVTEKVLSLPIVRRIEHLYGVTPKLAENECALLTVTETCSFECRTDCTQESLDKAKKYLQAYLEEGPGYSVTSENYNLDLVNMILLHRDDLEKQSATVITASPDSTNVKIQGQLQDLIMTKKLIQDYMKKGNISNSIQNKKPIVRETPPVPFVHEYFKTSRAQKTFEADDEDETDSENENEGTSPRGMLNTEKSSSLQHCMYPHLDAPPLATLGMSHDTSHDVSHDLSGEVTDTSDEEELLLDLQADPAYHNKVEFTLKLGYQETDLLRALRKVGIHAQENELLSELIQQDSSRPDNELDSDISGTAVDFDDSADFVYSRKQVVLGDPTSNLRHIIIDGSNVAMSHGNKEVFSCRGIQLAVDWFRQRGHSEITVFVPQWRKETPRAGTRIKDQTILTNLEKDKILVFTPARRIGGKRVVCYDDRYVLKLAVETDGVVVSNDNYRDLISEKEEFKKIIEERLLMYSFVNDRFMPPDDPLGREGPTLENFLLKRPSQPEPLPPPCPYGSKKCTYGNKCKYYHPERRNQPHKTVTEKLAEQTKMRMLEMKERNSQAECKKKLSKKMSLQRTKSFTPGETSHMAGSHDLSSALSGSVSTLEHTEDDRYRQYQQKTAEDLRKLEFEKALRQQQDTSQKKTLEKAGTRCKVNVGDLRASNNSPVMQGAPNDNNPSQRVTIDNLRNQGSTNDNMPSQGVTIENLRSQGSVIDNLRSQGSSRGSSPVSNLIVPGHGSNLDSGEQFISGHLLLAKKLSDEANSESDKLKNIARTEADRQNSSYCFGNTRGKSEEPARQKLKQPVKQALSRQLSLQGSEDPRLHQGHRSLQAQYSYDPRRVSFGNQFSHAGSEQSLHAVGAQSSDINRHTQDSYFGHASLSRMQSAPDPFVLQHNKQHKVPLVKRQNSSSDTQLDKLETECYGGTLPDGLFLAGLHSSPLSHVNKPMKDTTGAVTFQIGGSVQQRQQVPHYRSTGALSHVHQQAYNPSDRDAQYLPQYVQPHQASHQPHHPQALGAMYRDTYMNPVSQGMMQSFPTAQPAYLHSQSVLMESGPGYYDQSAVWESNLPNQTNISLPAHFHQTPMQRGMSRGSVSPHRASPNSQEHPHAIPYMFQQQQQQQQQQLWTGSSSQTSQPTSHTKPIPVNMAIPESDPRQKVFYHLCALFPEEKVLSVMNQHPECMDPKEICSYIITSS